LSAWVKGEKIVRGNPSWKIGLVGLSAQLRNGRWQHAGTEDSVGTFDWRKVAGVIDVPEDAVGLLLRLGLNGATGTMWVDDVEVERAD